MSLDPALREQILAAVPSLRAFAISLSGNVDRADDLVQETLLRAIANIHSFQPGTNMPAWLFTILRNLFRQPDLFGFREKCPDRGGGLLDQAVPPLSEGAGYQQDPDRARAGMERGLATSPRSSSLSRSAFRRGVRRTSWRNDASSGDGSSRR